MAIINSDADFVTVSAFFKNTYFIYIFLISYYLIVNYTIYSNWIWRWASKVVVASRLSPQALKFSTSASGTNRFIIKNAGGAVPMQLPGKIY